MPADVWSSIDEIVTELWPYLGISQQTLVFAAI
jgi:hypothetical protein